MDNRAKQKGIFKRTAEWILTELIINSTFGFHPSFGEMNYLQAMVAVWPV